MAQRHSALRGRSPGRYDPDVSCQWYAGVLGRSWSDNRRDPRGNRFESGSVSHESSLPPGQDGDLRDRARGHGRRRRSRPRSRDRGTRQRVHLRPVVQGRFLVQRRAKHRECGRWKRGRQLRQDRRRHRPFGQRQLRLRRPDEQQGERGRPHGRIRHQHRQRPSCGCRPRPRRQRRGATTFPVCSGTCGRSTRREAHAITGGSPSVVVGDIDTGLDFTHPDLAPNYDAANSADCSSGAPTASSRRATTTTATAPTPPARSPRQPTGSASSASPRT